MPRDLTKKNEAFGVISHPKSLANWHNPTAKPSAFIGHRIGDLALTSYSLLIKRSVADVI